MKILFLTQNQSGCMNPNYDSYTKEMKKQAETVDYGLGYPEYFKGVSLETIIKHFYGTSKPDIIYLYRCSGWAGTFNGWKETNIPKAVLIMNGHTRINDQLAIIEAFGFNAVLYASANYKQYFEGKLNIPLYFHPNMIDPAIYHDYGLPKKYDAVTSGMMNQFYPLRCEMKDRLRQLHGKIKVLIMPHWGYKMDTDVRYEKELKPKGCLWREDYARALNQSKVFLFDGGITKTAVCKYFEAMATKTLILAPLPAFPEQYHFIDGYNMVDVNHDNWEQKMFYYLQNENERKRIVDNAYETVMKYHTVQTRIKELLEILNGVCDTASFQDGLN